MSSSTSTADALEERITRPIDVVEGVNKEMVQIVYDHLPEGVKRNIPVSNPTEAVMNRIEQIKKKMRARLEKPKKSDPPASSTLDSEDETFPPKTYKEYKAQSTKVPGSFPGKSVFSNAVTGFTKKQKGNSMSICPKKPHYGSESDIVLIGNDCGVTDSDDVDELCFDSMEKSRVEQIFEDKQKKYSQEISQRLAEINRISIELDNFDKCKEPILDVTAKLQKQARSICSCTHSLEMEITRIKYEVGGVIPISPSDNNTCGDFCIKTIIDKVVELQQKVEKIRSRAALKAAFLSMSNASRCRISRQNKGLKKDIQKAIKIVKDYEVEFQTIKSSIVKGVCKKPMVKNRRVKSAFSGIGEKETDAKESDNDDDEDEGAAGYQIVSNKKDEWYGSATSRDNQNENEKHEPEQFQRGSYDDYSGANDSELQSYNDLATDSTESEDRYRGGKEPSQTKTQSKSSSNDDSEESILSGMLEEKQRVESNVVEATDDSKAKMVCFTITTSSSHKSSKSPSASQTKSADSQAYTDENNFDNEARSLRNSMNQTANGGRFLNYARGNTESHRVSRTRETFMEISKEMNGSELRHSPKFPATLTSKADKTRAYVVKPFSPRRPSSPRLYFDPHERRQAEGAEFRYHNYAADPLNLNEKIYGRESRASAERRNRGHSAGSPNSSARAKSGDRSPAKCKRSGKIEKSLCRCPGSSPGKRCACPNCKCAVFNQAKIQNSPTESVRNPCRCPKSSPGRRCGCINCTCGNQNISKAQQKIKKPKKRVCMCPGSSPGRRCPCQNCTCGDYDSKKTFKNGINTSPEPSQKSPRYSDRRGDSRQKKLNYCICSPRKGPCECSGCKCKTTPEKYADEFDRFYDDLVAQPGRDLPRMEDEIPRNCHRSLSFFEDDILDKRRRDPLFDAGISGSRRNKSPSSNTTGLKSSSQQSIVISGSEKSLSSECKCRSTDDYSSSESTRNKSKARTESRVLERKSAKNFESRERERSRSANRSKSSHRKSSSQFSSFCRCPSDTRECLVDILVSSSRSMNTSKSTGKSSTDHTGFYRGGSFIIPQKSDAEKSTESSSNANSSSNIKDYYPSQFDSSSKSDERAKEESRKQFESKGHKKSWISVRSQSLYDTKSHQSSSFCSCPPDEERCIISKSVSKSTNASRRLSEYGTDQTSPRRSTTSGVLRKVPSKKPSETTIESSSIRRPTVNKTMSSAQSSSLADNFTESSSYCKCSSTGRSEKCVCNKRKNDAESLTGSNSGDNHRNTNPEAITKIVSDWSKTSNSTQSNETRSKTMDYSGSWKSRSSLKTLSRDDYIRSNHGNDASSSVDYSNKNFSVCECQSSECLSVISSQTSKRISSTSVIGYKVSSSGKKSESSEKNLFEKRKDERASGGSSCCRCHPSGKGPCSECVCDSLILIPEELDSQKSLKTESKGFSTDRKSIFGDTSRPTKDPSIGKCSKSLSICKCRSSGEKPCSECTCNKKKDKQEISISQKSTENVEIIKSSTSARKSDSTSNASIAKISKSLSTCKCRSSGDKPCSECTCNKKKDKQEISYSQKSTVNLETIKSSTSAKKSDASSNASLSEKIIESFRHPHEKDDDGKSTIGKTFERDESRGKINAPIESGIYQPSQPSVAKIRDEASGEKFDRPQSSKGYIGKQSSSTKELTDSKQPIVTMDREPVMPATKASSKEQTGVPSMMPATKPKEAEIGADTIVTPSIVQREKPAISPSIVPIEHPESKKQTSQSIIEVPKRVPISQSEPKVDHILTADTAPPPSKKPVPDKGKSETKSSHEKIPSRQPSENVVEPAKPGKVKSTEITSVPDRGMPILADKSVTEDKQTDQVIPRKSEHSQQEIVPSKKPSKNIEAILSTTDPNDQTGLPPTVQEEKVSDRPPAKLEGEKPGKIKSRDTVPPPGIDGEKEISPQKSKPVDFGKDVNAASNEVSEKPSQHSAKVPREKPGKMKSHEKIISTHPSKNAVVVTDGSKPGLPDKSVAEDKETDDFINREPDHLQQDKVPSKNIDAISPPTGPSKAQADSPSGIPEAKITDKQPGEPPVKLEGEKPGKIKSRDTVLPPAVDGSKGTYPEKTKPADLGTEINPPSIGVSEKPSIHSSKVPKDKPGKIKSRDTVLPPVVDGGKGTYPEKSKPADFDTEINPPSIGLSEKPSIHSSKVPKDKPGKIKSRDTVLPPVVDGGKGTYPEKSKPPDFGTEINPPSIGVSEKPSIHSSKVPKDKPGKLKSKEELPEKSISPDKKPGDGKETATPHSVTVPEKQLSRDLTKSPDKPPLTGKLKSEEKISNEIPKSQLPLEQPKTPYKLQGDVGKESSGKPGQIIAKQPSKQFQQDGKQPGYTTDSPGEVGKQPSQQQGDVGKELSGRPGQIIAKQPSKQFQQDGKQPGYTTDSPGEVGKQPSQLMDKENESKSPKSQLALEQPKMPNKLQGDVGKEPSGKPGQIIAKQPSKQFQQDGKQPGYTTDSPGEVGKQPSQLMDKKNEWKDIASKPPAKPDASKLSLQPGRKHSKDFNIIDPNAGKHISQQPSQNINRKPDEKPLVSKIVPGTSAKDVTPPNAAIITNEIEPLVDQSKDGKIQDKPAFIYPEKGTVPHAESPSLPKSDAKQSVGKITSSTPAAKQPSKSDQFISKPPQSASPNQSIPQPSKPSGSNSPAIPSQTVPDSLAKPPQATPPQATPPQVTPPQVTPPQATPPQATSPQATPPQATPPQATPPQATPPQATPPQVTPPQATPPQATPPQATPPQATAPQATAPQATAPQATAPQATPPQATPPNQVLKQPGKLPETAYDPLMADANNVKEQLKTCQENLLKYETENTKLINEGKISNSDRQKMLNDLTQFKKQYEECLADNATNKTIAQQMLSLQTENSDLKKELNNMKILLEQRQAGNVAQIDKNKQSLNEISKPSDKAPDGSLDCLPYIQKITFLETQLATLTRQNESNLKEFSECKAKLDRCQDDLSKCYKELSKDPAIISPEIAKPISTVDCQEWIDLANKYEAQLKEYTVNTVRSSFMTKMIDRERNELKNERDELKGALKKCQDDLTKCLTEHKGEPLQNQVDSLINELQKLKALNEQQELEKASLTRQRDEALTNVSKAQEKLQQYELEIQMVATGGGSRIGEQYAKLRSENNRLIAELDEKKREISKLLANLESYSKRWNECKLKLEVYGKQLDSKSFTQLMDPIAVSIESKESGTGVKPTVESKLSDGDGHKVQGSGFRVDMSKCISAAEQVELQNQIKQHRKDVKEMQRLYENLQCVIQKVIHKLNYRPCCENIQDELAKIYHALNCIKNRICSCADVEQEIEFNPQCMRGEDPVVHRICLQVVISGIRSLNFKQLIYLHCAVYRIGTSFGKTNCSRFPCEQFRCLSSNLFCNKDEDAEKDKTVKCKKSSFEKIKLLECEMDRTKKLLKNFKKCCN